MSKYVSQKDINNVKTKYVKIGCLGVPSTNDVFEDNVHATQTVIHSIRLPRWVPRRTKRHDKERVLRYTMGEPSGSEF